MQQQENTITTPEYQAAKAQLMQHLQTLGCVVSGQKSENSAGEHRTVISANGDEQYDPYPAA
ncbi:MAG: hypothetical protein J0I41_14605 [Filimonas sp.]|nr:hypothetical protein [Filimonas sp.]